VSDRARLWLWGAVLGVMVTIAVLAGLTAVYVADSVRPAQESRQALQRALRLLVECTTAPELRDPPETQPLADDCYLRQQRAQSKIVGEPDGPINTVAVAASACGAAHPGDVAATLRCVREAVGR
jgi:hypothetical protein